MPDEELVKEIIDTARRWVEEGKRDEKEDEE